MDPQLVKQYKEVSLLIDSSAQRANNLTGMLGKQFPSSKQLRLYLILHTYLISERLRLIYGCNVDTEAYDVCENGTDNLPPWKQILILQQAIDQKRSDRQDYQPEAPKLATRGENQVNLLRQRYWLAKLHLEALDKAEGKVKALKKSPAEADILTRNECWATVRKSTLCYYLMDEAHKTADQEIISLAASAFFAARLSANRLFPRQAQALKFEHGNAETGLYNELIGATALALAEKPNVEQIYNFPCKFLNDITRELGLKGGSKRACLEADLGYPLAAKDLAADPAEQFVKKEQQREQIRDLINAAGFSPKERQVFDLMAQGFSETEIATRMERKLGTIRSWRSRVIKKLKRAVEKLQEEKI